MANLRQLVWPSGLLPFSILCITAAAYSKLPCNLIKATCLTYLQNGNMLIAVFIFSKLVRSFFPRGHLSLSYRRAIRSFSLSPIAHCDRVTVSKRAKYQDPETKAAKCDSVIIILFLTAVLFLSRNVVFCGKNWFDWQLPRAKAEFLNFSNKTNQKV